MYIFLYKASYSIFLVTSRITVRENCLTVVLTSYKDISLEDAKKSKEIKT